MPTLPPHDSGHTHRISHDPVLDCGTYGGPPGCWWAEIWSGGQWQTVGPYRIDERQARLDVRVNAQFWEVCNPGLRCSIAPEVQEV